MTRIAIVADVHLADTPPGRRTSDYAERILEKVAEVSVKARAAGCEALVVAGDLFHIKTPSRTSHRLVVSTASALNAGGLPVLVVAGNHDLSHADLGSVAAQPIGSLSLDRNIEILHGPHPELPVWGSPWLENTSDSMVALNAIRRLRWVEDTGGLTVAHASWFPDDLAPPYEHAVWSDVAKHAEHGDVYYGHIHENLGVAKISGSDVTLAAFGSLSRGSLSQGNLDHKPVWTIYDTADRSFTATSVKCARPPEEVYVDLARTLASRADAKTHADRIHAFLDAARGFTVHRATADEVEKALLQIDGLDPQVVSVAVQAVRKVAEQC